MPLSGIEKKPQAQTVYNFSVQEFSTYFVGKSALWVHNAGYGTLSDLLDRVAAAPVSAAEKKRLIEEGLSLLDGDYLLEWQNVPSVDGYIALGYPHPTPDGRFDRIMLYIAPDGTMWEGFESAIMNGIVDLAQMRPRPFR